MAVVSPGAAAADLAAIYTTSGNEVTDATRIAAQSWTTGASGGMVDGETPPAGIGVWRPATNLFPNGQCAAPTGWSTPTTGVTISTDSATPAPFSPQSIKYVCDGTAGNQGALPLTAAGQAAAAGVIGAGSCWFKGVQGQAYRAVMSWANTDASITAGATATFTGTGGWQLITPAPVAVAAGKTGDVLRMTVGINGSRAETIWAAHAMLEIGVPQIAPYVATSGGTATHGVGRVYTDGVGVVTVAQGWVAARVKMGYPSSVAGTLYVAQPSDGSAANRLAMRPNGANWVLIEVSGNVTSAAVTQTAAFSVGDYVTAVFAWDASGLYVSINGAAFTSAARGTQAIGPFTTFDVGSNLGDPLSTFNGNVDWLVCGEGTLAASDVAALNALPNIMPAVFPPVAAGLTGRLLTYTPVGPKFRRVNVGEPVVIVR